MSYTGHVLKLSLAVGMSAMVVAAGYLGYLEPVCGGYAKFHNQHSKHEYFAEEEKKSFDLNKLSREK